MPKSYGADGYAVKELLKIALVLHEAYKVSRNQSADDAPPPTSTLASRLHEVKRARQLTSEITGAGASLYDLLNSEQEQREERNRALSKPLDLTTIERSLSRALEGLQQSIDGTDQRLTELAADERDLVSRIEKRKQDLERGKKRLESLQGVRYVYPPPLPTFL